MLSQDEAYQFLLSGGRLSVDDWSRLDEATKVALVEAGDKIRAENLTLIGHMIRDPADGIRRLAPEPARFQTASAAVLRVMGGGAGA